MAEGCVDICVLSKDRPMQLYALCESIEQFLTGYNTISIVYRATNSEFDSSYTEVKKKFSKFNFIKQSESNFKNDFKPLVLESVFNQKADYVMFAVDDNIIKSEIDLKKCCLAMKNENCYAFLLRLGLNIKSCYMLKIDTPAPNLAKILDDIAVFDCREAKGDWNYPNNVDMTIYKKSDIKTLLYSLEFTNPWQMEGNWAARFTKNYKCACYIESKIFNLDINLVNQTGNWGQFTQADLALIQNLGLDDLNTLFKKGWKIDIEQFEHFANESAHMVIAPRFIHRK